MLDKIRGSFCVCVCVCDVSGKEGVRMPVAVWYKKSAQNPFIERIFLHHSERGDSVSPEKISHFAAQLFLIKNDNNLTNSFIKTKK